MKFSTRFLLWGAVPLALLPWHSSTDSSDLFLSSHNASIVRVFGLKQRLKWVLGRGGRDWMTRTTGQGYEGGSGRYKQACCYYESELRRWDCSSVAEPKLYWASGASSTSLVKSTSEMLQVLFFSYFHLKIHIMGGGSQTMRHHS